MFCEVFAATPFNLALDSKCDLHVLLSERQQEAADLALGVFEFKTEGELRRVCSLWKDGATSPLKVLDGNCCTVAREPVTFLTGSRMSTFWTLMRDLPALKECVKAWPLSRIVSELAGGSVRQAVQGYANLPNPPEGGGRPTCAKARKRSVQFSVFYGHAPRGAERLLCECSHRFRMSG